jgi:hypothetical protein
MTFAFTLAFQRSFNDRTLEANSSSDVPANAIPPSAIALNAFSSNDSDRHPNGLRI